MYTLRVIEEHIIVECSELLCWLFQLTLEIILKQVRSNTVEVENLKSKLHSDFFRLLIILVLYYEYAS